MDGDNSHEIRRRSLEGKLWQPRPYIKNQRHHFADRGPHGQSYGLSSSHVQIWDLDHKEGWVLKNRSVQDAWEFFGLQGDPTGQSQRKSTLNIHLKEWCWSSNTLATWCKEPTHWKRPWCWERLRAGGEGGDRGWDGWLASLPQWTWVWANSGRYSEGQGRLACCSPWGCKELDTTEQLNSNKWVPISMRCMSPNH